MLRFPSADGAMTSPFWMDGRERWAEEGDDGNFAAWGT